MLTCDVTNYFVLKLAASFCSVSLKDLEVNLDISEIYTNIERYSQLWMRILDLTLETPVIYLHWSLLVEVTVAGE